jgi:dipeptidyl aminopeptidase/acylaminoacyl peptidase
MAPRISIRDFFQNPANRNYQLSPDGKKIAFLKPWRDRLNLYLKDGPSGAEQRLTAETRRDIPTYVWKSDRYLIYQLDVDVAGSFHLYRVDLSDSARPVPAVDLTPILGVDAYFIHLLEGISPTDILIGLNERDLAWYDVCRVNLAAPRPNNIDIVCRNDFNVTRGGWFADNTGRIRAARTRDGTEIVWRTRANETSPFNEVIRTDFTEKVEFLAFNSSNDAVYALSNIGRDKKALVVIDPANGRETACIYAHPDVDLAGASFSSKRNVVTYVWFDTDKGEREILDRGDTAAIFGEVERKLPGRVLDIVSSDANETKFILSSVSDRHSGSRYYYDATTRHLQKLADVYPWLKESELAPVQPIQFQSRDHHTIHGYLTLPLDRRAEEKLPLIVNVHSGPWWRDVWQYTTPESAEVQFLANRGYAVLQINFRGSQRYGRDFWKLGFKQWGRAMQDDITDGVAWAVNSGFVDPERIAIYGKSYGGYAALAGVAFTPDLYKAAIDYAGESNLLTYMKGFPPWMKPEMPEYYAKVGNPITDHDWLAAVSPAKHADKIKVPVLIAHGGADPIVRRSQSDRMVAALHGVDVYYMVRPGEGHLFQNQENKIDFYTVMEAFLAKYLPPFPVSGQDQIVQA